jgi:hypothetical protein
MDVQDPTFLTERAPKAMRLRYYNLISFISAFAAQASENIKTHGLDCHLWKSEDTAA